MKKLFIALFALIMIFALFSCEETPSHDHFYCGETVEPTCKEKGYAVYTCECGDTYIEECGEPTGECLYESHITHEATLTEPGYYEYICTWCKESKTEIFMDSLVPTEGFIYELNEDGTGYVIVGTEEGYDHNDNIVIPEYYEGLPVVEIAEGVELGGPTRFFIFDNLVKIAPSSLSSYVRSYFVSENNPAYCSLDGVLYSKDMKTLVKFAEGGTGDGADVFLEYTVPETVEAIGDYAFKSSDYNGAFYLTKITFGANVKTVGESAFEGCRSLISAELNEGLVSIGNKAFNACENLSSIKLPTSLESVGNEAFAYNKALTSIHFPQNVKNIGEKALLECVSLINISVSNDNETYYGTNGVLYTKDRKVILAYPAGKPDKRYVVPNEVETVSAYAFYYAQHLKELVISNSLHTIEEKAFEGCILLESIEFSDSLRTIAAYAFRGCISLNSVVLGSNVEYVGEYSFYQCRQLAQVYIPKSVTYLGGYAFGEIMVPVEATYEGSDADWGNITFDVSHPFSGSSNVKIIFLGDAQNEE